MAINIEVDVVVVGCGIGGLSAAVSALQSGCRVAVLERAPGEDYGGNSRWTESYLRMKNDREVSDDFDTSFALNAGYHLDPNILATITNPYVQWPGFVRAHGFPDPDLISAFAEHAGPILQWLKGFGIRFDQLPTYFSTSTAAPRLMPVGGGLAMIEALSAYGLNHGLEIFYETTAQRLLQDEDGAIAGVIAVDSSRRVKRFTGKAVVLASGGYEGNPEMLAQYLGAQSRHIRPVARGGYYNKGEGIRMALAIGAAPAGDYASYHAEPVDPRSRLPEAVIFVFPYGILVNTSGHRFLDEAPGTVDQHYDHIARAFAEQPDGLAYVIYDHKIDDVPNWRASIRSDQPPIQANTLEDLATMLALPADVLASTIGAFNAACPCGTFKALEPDGLATVKLNPPKSNWSRPIDSPPFYAYPLISANCFTFGGLKVNSHAQVLDSDGRIIPRLFAAGETVGIYYQTYTGATSVLKAAVFGRLGGLHAAQHNENQPHAAVNEHPSAYL